MIKIKENVSRIQILVDSAFSVHLSIHIFFLNVSLFITVTTFKSFHVPKCCPEFLNVQNGEIGAEFIDLNWREGKGQTQRTRKPFHNSMIEKQGLFHIFDVLVKS